ncbi:MAG: N-acetylmuramoyl-L-alanine amidase [Bacteroidetes bacterium]|nr:N-acetylmuramoyl-L-alanine amidase [Bacteroidota bacterium]
MKKSFVIICSTIFIALIFFGCTSKQILKEEKAEKKELSAAEKVNTFKQDISKRKFHFTIPIGTRVDTVIIDSTKKTFTINLNRQFSFLPFRAKNVEEIYSEVKRFFAKDFNDFKFSIRSLNYPIEEFIPNYFRKDSTQYDSNRIPHAYSKPLPVAENLSKKSIPTHGLFNRNIVIAPSHGWYYNSKEDKWEWQRPRLFQSVEDLLPTSFCIPYLIPMLENAGATVFDPRERDIQTNSVVVDNDSKENIKSKKYFEQVKSEEYEWSGKGNGFAEGNPPYPVDYNPFTKGTYRETNANSTATASINWTPDIPAEGYYAVYISYHSSKQNVNDANYIVIHDEIKTDFKVNEQIGGSTWQYLGTFKFSKGLHPDEDKVILTNKSATPGKIVSGDAVRFGGGMGIVIRGGRTSGRPKFVEGSRYYLQYAGIPDSLYDFNKSQDDYNDDKQDRSKYVNYLNGNSSNDKNDKGLGIPIDLSLAFHTDAGITHNDTTVGTLALYGIKGEDGKSTFPNGVSRLASRDLADIIQTQITSDIRSKYDPAWNRRQIMDEEPSNDVYPQQYSEVYRPNVPSVLIELLSHQNFLDMKFALDPQFRFDVARAIYKGMLRFLAVQNHVKYVVEPLPVTHFCTDLNNNGDVILKWQPTVDSLEPTAKPDGYIVYTRIGNGDFDNGIFVKDTLTEFKNVKPNIIYSYKITAINKGGESFPSEILSAARTDNGNRPVLIINGFERVSAPASIDSKQFSGFLNKIDPGVADKYNINFVGQQYDFNPKDEWKSNDEPGWGGSHADYEGKVIAGNTFDYPFIHGESILKCGYPFVSASVKSVIDGNVDLIKYKFIDLILGEQKSTRWQKAIEDSIRGIRFKTFPSGLQKKITEYCQSGGNIFISGSYVASDLFNEVPRDSSDIKFAENILKYKLDTDHASNTGEVFSDDQSFLLKFDEFDFNTELNNKIYAATAPDAIDQINGSKTILRYKENQFPAATAYKDKYGVVVFGFPFETILERNVRDEVMKTVLNNLGL